METQAARDAIDVQLDHLDSLAERLNQEIEAVNLRLLDIEDRLLESGVGVEAEGPVFLRETDAAEDGNPDPVTVRYRLAYGKYAGTFRIYVNCYELLSMIADEDIGSPTPDWSRLIGECKRNVRFAALSGMPGLLDAIQEKTTKLLESIAAGDEVARRSIEI